MPCKITDDEIHAYGGLTWAEALEALCQACRVLEEMGDLEYVSPKTQAWFDQHCKRDAEIKHP